jgi:hypothetical protein
MNVNRFNNFAELYRAALAEADESKKTTLLREVDRIIRSTEADPAIQNNYSCKAA